MNDSSNINEDVVINTLLEAITQGSSLKDILDVPQDTMDNMYAYAYEFYQQGKLDEAEKFFEFLCMYDLQNADYFLGLGAVYQLKKQYEKASDFYALSFALSTNDYISVFYTGQCQMLLGNVPRAAKCFGLVIEQSKSESFILRAKVYLDTLKSSMDKSVNDNCGSKEST